MPNLLEQAAAWLADQQARHAASDVTYSRGEASAVVPATLGRTVFEVHDQVRGTIEKVESRDFLIRTSDLVLTGQAVLPERGDRIHEPQGSQTGVYEVLAPGHEQVFRFSDPYRRQLRIHTKRIGTE